MLQGESLLSQLADGEHSSVDASPSKTKRVCFRLLLALASTILTIALVEVYLRATRSRVVLDDEGLFDGSVDSISTFGPKGKRLVPGIRATIQNHPLSGEDVDLRTNSHGFRGAEIPGQKPESEMRILVLGDSITLGAYLAESDVYVSRIEDSLQDSFKSRTVRVVNAGVSGIGTEDEVNILEEQGIQTQPDLVLLAFYLNDSRPPWGFSAELGYKGWLRRNSLLSDKIYRAFVLNRWIEEQGDDRFSWIYAVDLLDWRHNRDDFLHLAWRARYDWGSAWEDGSWKVIEDQLKRLRKLAGEHGFQVAVVTFPVSFQVSADFVEDTPQRRLQGIASAMELPYLDLLPLLREHNSQDLFFDMCHPKKDTNDLIGKRIAEFLASDVLPY